jgi:hypothetical protein
MAAENEKSSPWVIAPARTRLIPYQKTAATPKDAKISTTGAAAESYFRTFRMNR